MARRGAGGGAPARIDFSGIWGAAALMGVQAVGQMSLGHWLATLEGWRKSQAGTKADAPSDEDFERVLAQSEGLPWH
ncbi:hypothetical protein [Rhizobium sp. G21]|uniref:hypothetical protein n=1 Tax=Rhizobium sp. G21 TaxID=2758439 RepID=UPI001604953B|nr:hypothetical protein [Rhizobium sp. G21]MBB1247458.1 hypothetical protein [Rhizobium sp. G21]